MSYSSLTRVHVLIFRLTFSQVLGVVPVELQTVMNSPNITQVTLASRTSLARV